MNGETDYERYIRTSELLSLQKPVDQLANHDELFFQSIHQAMELWFKVAGFEVVKVSRHLDDGDAARASHHLRRIAAIIDYVGDGLPILETLAQADYHEIRLALGRGSGQDSPGFNQLLQSLPQLWEPFARWRERRQAPSLLDVMAQPHGPAADVYAVISGFIDVDKAFQQFRYRHLQLARREIGLAVKSLKGVPARNMEQGVLKALYPELWSTVEELTIKTNPVYG
jgi:tryptophan 2,3-dioxygenase